MDQGGKTMLYYHGASWSYHTLVVAIRRGSIDIGAMGAAVAHGRRSSGERPAF